MGIKCNPRTVTDGLVLALDAGNTKSYPGSGITWTDLIGRGNTGTLTNGPTYNNTSGGSIVFDGTNDNVSIGTNGFSFGSSPGTLSAWAKTRDRESTGTIVSYGNAASNQARFLGVGQSNFYFSGYGSSISASGLSYDTWFNIVGVYDGTNAASMYVNGALVAGPTFRSWNTTASNAGIGKNVNNSEYWNGNVAQVQIYNRELSAAEIQQNYNSFKGRYVNYITASIYPFTSFTFTNATAEGTLGPTLANLQSTYSAQSWASNTGYLDLFNSTRGYQRWVVPGNGTYRITAAGAQGGAGKWGSYYGGFGVIMRSTITLVQGDYLIFVVGQRGGYVDNSIVGSSGGGGGTFVFKNNLSTPILIAGGGGGGGGNSSPVNGRPALTTNNGDINSSGSAGGAGGAGGPAYSGGGGGSGLTGNGGAGASTAAGGLNITSSGGTGGRGGNCGTSQESTYGNRNFGSLGQDQGGFGGGGGGEWCVNGSVGGGGGYSGGAGSNGSSGVSGGGGSYVNVSLATLIATSTGTYNGAGSYTNIGYNGSTSVGTIFSNIMGYVEVEKI